MSGLPYQPAGVQSFAVQVRLARGLSPAQEAAFQRRVEAWLADRDLLMEGGQVAFGVVAERELSPIDQADVIIMLLDDATVRQARVGPLIGEQDDLSLEVTGLLWVEASQPDPLVDAARLLYEASRLSGAAFLKALGGYTYRTDEHPGGTAMTTTGTPDPQDSVSPAAVYLLQRHDGQRFKIGWAVEPMARVKRLPEFMADELDLRASHAAWLPSPTRARQIERSLHRGLATQRAEPPHQLEGHTEWFVPAALRTAMRMLRQMPAGGTSSQPAALVPFDAAPQPLLDAATTDADSAVLVSAQDVLWAMEDLLLRACALNPVLVEGQGEYRTVRLKDVRGPRAKLGDAMRWALVDLDTYRWAGGGRSGSFVHLMAYEGNDLLLQITPTRTVRRWADGALNWQVQALLERLRGLAAYAQSAADLSCAAGNRP